MSVIPLDLQRRFEQRWAARFTRPTPVIASEKHEHEKQGQQLGALAKARKEPPPGVMSATGGASAGSKPRVYAC
jgi:hypothetical protein